MQGHTQAQNDAHQAAQDAQHDWDEAHGIEYEEIPNTGQAVTDHLAAQTAGNGSASVPPGTHLSADGKTILIPKQSDTTEAGQLLKYNTFQAAYGLPAGTSPDWATRWNSFATKAATGTLTPQLAAQGNELMDILKQGALMKLYQQQAVLAKGRGIDPSAMPSIDSNGNITTFDKVKGAPTGVPSGNVVSLTAARQLPLNQGKSDAQIIADIQAHGHQVGQ